jgi:hypothetical protein
MVSVTLEDSYTCIVILGSYLTSDYKMQVQLYFHCFMACTYVLQRELL